MDLDIIYNENCLSGLKKLPDNSIDCCITSPPYWGLRDYGEKEQLGMEETPEEFIKSLTKVFLEVKRVLKEKGTLWLNLGDTYATAKAGNTYGSSTSAFGKSKYQEGLNNQVFNKKRPSGYKHKDLIGIPWMCAFSLRKSGWYLRQDIIWSKGSCMPESVTDRCTKSHEYVFLLSKSQKYYFDNIAIQEPSVTKDNSNRDRDNSKLNNTPGKSKSGGLKTNQYEMRNKRSVWKVNTKPFKGSHFATFPEKLIYPMVLAGCPEQGIILDPFMGAGTTAVVAKKLNRHYIGYELNNEYVSIANKRIHNEIGLFM